MTWWDLCPECRGKLWVLHRRAIHPLHEELCRTCGGRGVVQVVAPQRGNDNPPTPPPNDIVRKP